MSRTFEPRSLVPCRGIVWQGIEQHPEQTDQFNRARPRLFERDVWFAVTAQDVLQTPNFGLRQAEAVAVFRREGMIIHQDIMPRSLGGA